MPIEIRELVLKATIQNGMDQNSQADENSPINKEELIADCVDEVMALLNEQSER